MRRALSPFNQNHLTRISMKSGAEPEPRSPTLLTGYIFTDCSVGLRCRVDPSGLKRPPIRLRTFLNKVKKKKNPKNPDSTAADACPDPGPDIWECWVLGFGSKCCLVSDRESDRTESPLRSRPFPLFPQQHCNPPGGRVYLIAPSRFL